MMNFFSKLKFLFKKPKVIIIVGRGRAYVKKIVLQILKRYPEMRKDVLVLEMGLTGDSEMKKFEQMIKNYSQPILVATHTSDILLRSTVFASEREKADRVHIIINFDDEAAKKIKNSANVKEITFGFGEGADFRATDISLNTGTNFKVNYQGNFVPVWLEGIFEKERIYSALAAIAVGATLGLNLVEISQALRSRQEDNLGI